MEVTLPMQRGFFYSLSVLVLVAPVLALMLFYADLSTSARSATVSEVVSAESLRVIQGIEADFERALLSSSRSAAVSAVGKVVNDGQPLSDARVAIRNLVVNGSFGPGEPVYPSMGQNFLSRWTSNMRQLSSAYGLDVTLEVTQVNVSSKTPSSLVFSANLSLFVQPQKEPAAFNFTKSYFQQVAVSIEGFEDPLFSLNTNGVLSRVFSFNATNVGNISALEAFVSEKKYAPNPDSPDFFYRLEGKLLPSPNGVETIINPNELSAQDLPIHAQSHADHFYFNSTMPNQGRRVLSSTHPWLQLDCPHAAYFGVTDQTEGC